MRALCAFSRHHDSTRELRPAIFHHSFYAIPSPASSPREPVLLPRTQRERFCASGVREFNPELLLAIDYRSRMLESKLLLDGLRDRAHVLRRCVGCIVRLARREILH
jgi:hypothetical protein